VNTAPEETGILKTTPWIEDWHQIATEMSAAINEMLDLLERDKIEVAIAGDYNEVVEKDDLPTHDFLHAVSKDLETHGKLIVTLHPFPEPEGYDRGTDFEMLVAAVGQTPIGLELRVLRLGQEQLRRIQQVAEGALKDDASEPD